MALKVQQPLENNLQLILQKIMQLSRENIFMSVLENVSSFPVVLSSNSFHSYNYHPKNVTTIPTQSLAEETSSFLRPNPHFLQGDQIGSISAMFESGGVNSAGAVGYDPNGGTSYGVYQISSKKGSMDEFLNFLEKIRPEWAHRLKQAGTPDTGSTRGNFPKEWKAIARENPLEFAKIQHEFIKEKYFDPLCQLLAKEYGIKINNSHPAIQEAVWSTAVQHGVSGAKRIIAQAYIKAGRKLSEKFLENLYELRATNFSSSPSRIRQSVLKRFHREKELILAQLERRKSTRFSVTA